MKNHEYRQFSESQYATSDLFRIISREKLPLLTTLWKLQEFRKNALIIQRNLRQTSTVSSVLWDSKMIVLTIFASNLQETTSFHPNPFESRLTRRTTEISSSKRSNVSTKTLEFHPFNFDSNCSDFSNSIERKRLNLSDLPIERAQS